MQSKNNYDEGITITIAATIEQCCLQFEKFRLGSKCDAFHDCIALPIHA